MMPTHTADEWIDQYVKKGAYWFHDDNFDRPHALLSSGMHSNGFFNSKPIIADDALLRAAAHDIVDRFEAWFGYSLDLVGRVVGPATGATRLAEFVADEVGARRGKACPWSSPVKSVDEVTGEKVMIFDSEESAPRSGEKILLVEDVITTGGSTNLTAEAVKRHGATPFMCVGVIVNRSKLDKDLGERTILANVHKEMSMWEPKDCPLCKKGSEPIRPKPAEDTEGRNWARLTAEY
jgi:orotate phosphoribosyltransferase